VNSVGQNIQNTTLVPTKGVNLSW